MIHFMDVLSSVAFFVNSEVSPASSVVLLVRVAMLSFTLAALYWLLESRAYVHCGKLAITKRLYPLGAYKVNEVRNAIGEDRCTVDLVVQLERILVQRRAEAGTTESNTLFQS